MKIDPEERFFEWQEMFNQLLIRCSSNEGLEYQITTELSFFIAGIAKILYLTDERQRKDFFPVFFNAFEEAIPKLIKLYEENDLNQIKNKSDCEA